MWYQFISRNFWMVNYSGHHYTVLAKQWGSNVGDKLGWSLEARKDEIVILVKKAKPKSGKKKG
jgi:hypothetical protein